MGEAMAKGFPIVFTTEGRKPEIVCEPGKEAQAVSILNKVQGGKFKIDCESGKELETLERLHREGKIDLMRPHSGSEPSDTLAVYGEQKA